MQGGSSYNNIEEMKEKEFLNDNHLIEKTSHDEKIEDVNAKIEGHQNSQESMSEGETEIENINIYEQPPFTHEDEEDLVGTSPINLPDPSLFSDIHDNDMWEGVPNNSGNYYGN